MRFKVDNLAQFKKKALHWADQYPNFAYYENNNIPFRYGSFKNILAIDNIDEIGIQKSENSTKRPCFEVLKDFIDNNRDWLFGYFSYDLKNEIPACQPGKEPLFSNNTDHLQFPSLHFFKPGHIIFFNKNEITIESSTDPQEVYKKITELGLDSSLRTEQVSDFIPTTQHSFNIQERVTKEEYLQTVKKIQNHIIEGDIYELNYCIEFFSENALIDPIQTFLTLNKNSPMPFAGMYKVDNKYLLCASPERFMKKITNIQSSVNSLQSAAGNIQSKSSYRRDKYPKSLLISQPIKGTIQRGKSPVEDMRLKQKLLADEKELAENLMIVDIVRNDLARSSKTGSVNVDELFGIYKFKNLFQMISTVTSELKDNCHFVDAIKNAFPMGSMTGAPKIRAMELIEQYEKTKRGLFSGSFGYIIGPPLTPPDGGRTDQPLTSPGGKVVDKVTPSEGFRGTSDFDFNVVIRSILYNQATNYLSFQVGSAITYDSIPEKEYDECMLKAKAIMNTLKS